MRPSPALAVAISAGEQGADFGGVFVLDAGDVTGASYLEGPTVVADGGDPAEVDFVEPPAERAAILRRAGGVLNANAEENSYWQSHEGGAALASSRTARSCEPPNRA
ncbi:hypothetical protein [Nocardiopsis listeri]|uniref:hypothetical protein n=1 Tax=Nocardiopsis listeri TaxID=53440 RepID=UPI00082FCAF0|nr:hypothetical protein [Nocardiopsis listeri]